MNASEFLAKGDRVVFTYAKGDEVAKREGVVESYKANRAGVMVLTIHNGTQFKSYRRDRMPSGPVNLTRIAGA